MRIMFHLTKNLGHTPEFTESKVDKRFFEWVKNEKKNLSKSFLASSALAKENQLK
jgi:hypothetical protein